MDKSSNMSVAESLFRVLKTAVTRPINVAVAANKEKLVALLLNAGAKPGEDAFGLSTLHIAAFNGNRALCDAIIDKYPNELLVWITPIAPGIDAGNAFDAPMMAEIGDHSDLAGYLREKRKALFPVYRNDETAVVLVAGDELWCRGEEIHREDGPAVERADGGREWYQNGQRHREDGPAIERADGYKAWCRNGQRHREDGPAIEHADGTREWWLNGKRMPEPLIRTRYAKTLGRS